MGKIVTEETLFSVLDSYEKRIAALEAALKINQQQKGQVFQRVEGEIKPAKQG